MVSVKFLEDIASNLRRDVIIGTSHAGSGHLTSSFSCADIISVLFFNELSLDSSNPNNPENDEFVLSKGHAAPVYYAGLIRRGLIKEDIETLRKLTSNLEGHPIPSHAMPWIKVATGSLGQGLSVGCGMALASKM